MHLEGTMAMISTDEEKVPPPTHNLAPCIGSGWGDVSVALAYGIRPGVNLHWAFHLGVWIILSLSELLCLLGDMSR